MARHARLLRVGHRAAGSCRGPATRVTPGTGGAVLPHCGPGSRFSPMHSVDATAEQMIRSVLAYAERRLRLDPVPLDGGPREPAELRDALRGLLGDQPRDPDEVLGVYTATLAPAVLSADSPRFLGFIPAAPTKAALAFDMLVSCASIQGISWLEAAGAIEAENQVLMLIADRAGLPESAGGCFVSGGSAANLSALVVAREMAKRRVTSGPAGRWRVIIGADAHSSIINTLRILEMDALTVRAGDHRITGAALRAAIRPPWPPWGRRQAPPMPGSSTTWPGSPPSPAPTGSGCMWTAPTAGPGCSRRASGGPMTASSIVTRSSSTRTSGCSRRTTAPLSCTATLRWPVRCTARTLPTWTSSTTTRRSGIPPITRIT